MSCVKGWETQEFPPLSGQKTFVLPSNALVYRPTGETAHQASGTLEAEKNKPTGDLNKKAHQASCLAFNET